MKFVVIFRKQKGKDYTSWYLQEKMTDEGFCDYLDRIYDVVQTMIEEHENEQESEHG